MSLSVSLSSFTARAGSDNLVAAGELVEHLESAGHSAMVLQSLHELSGLAIVHSGGGDEEDEVVLVSTGDVDGVRQDVKTFMQVPIPPSRPHIVGSIDMPADVDQLFSDDPVARLERRLSRGDEIALGRALADAVRMSKALVPVIREYLDVDLDTEPKAVWRKIDELVLKLRPPGIGADEAADDEAVFPIFTIIALGLIATEAVMRIRPESTLGSVSRTGWVQASTLAEAGGFPSLRIGENMTANVANKVLKRWYHGSVDSVEDMVVATLHQLREVEQSEGEENLSPAEVAEREVRLDQALGTACAQLKFQLKSLAEPGPVLPSVWALVDGNIQLHSLMAEGSGMAAVMASQVVERVAAKGATAASGLIDVFLTLPDGRIDALQVTAYVPGTPARIQLALPYAKDGDEVVFPRGFQLTTRRGVPDSYDMERIASALLGGLSDEGIEGRVPRELSTDVQDAMTKQLARAGSMAASKAEEDEVDDNDGRLLLRLAGLSPFAAFLVVASADGEVEEKEIDAFMAAVEKLDDPVLMLAMAAVPGGAHGALKLLMGDVELARRALAAAGVLFGEREESLSALFDMVLDVARTQGSLRDEEKVALITVRGLLEGGRELALAGGDPFQAAKMAPELERMLPIASFAVYAAFLLVAAADGEFEEREANAFNLTLAALSDPLLQRMVDAGEGDTGDRLKTLLENKELVVASLHTAGRIFEQHPDGAEARAALMNMMELVAGGDDIGPQEQKALKAIGSLLDGEEPREGNPLVGLAILALLGTGALGVVGVLIWGLTQLF